MDKKRLQELAGVDLTEKFEDYTEEDLLQEIEAQYKNLSVYAPHDMEEIRRFGPAIAGSARDLAEAVDRLLKILNKSTI